MVCNTYMKYKRIFCSDLDLNPQITNTPNSLNNSKSETFLVLSIFLEKWYWTWSKNNLLNTVYCYSAHMLIVWLRILSRVALISQRQYCLTALVPRVSTVLLSLPSAIQVYVRHGTETLWLCIFFPSLFLRGCEVTNFRTLHLILALQKIFSVSYFIF